MPEVSEVALMSTGLWGEGRFPVVMTRIHSRSQCAPHSCWIHEPSDHHMLDWPMLWRADRRILERTCPHGVGHPDPDDVGYHVRNGRTSEGIHGCDGCCSNVSQ
jgi:hypothetical protein